MSDPGTGSFSASRTRSGCQNCKVKHLKCDERRPTCAQCAKIGIECVRTSNVRFRHGANPSVVNVQRGAATVARPEYSFSNSQPWVRTGRHLTFLDETPELRGIYDHTLYSSDGFPTSVSNAITGDLPSTDYLQGYEPSNLTPKNAQPQHSCAEPQNDTSYSGPSSPEKRRRLMFDSPIVESVSSSSLAHRIHSPSETWQSSPHTPWTPTVTDNSVHSSTVRSSQSLEQTEKLREDNLEGNSGASGVYLDGPVWPLQDREEARLLRYFVDRLARSFDLTDPLKHFQRVVPQRAATCPTLLNAILALSARHLSRTDRYDSLASNKYHQRCLEHLIPMLDDRDAILDENLLASTIVLRNLEEIELPLSGQSPSDQTNHLIGSNSLIMAQERATISGGLRQAAFWVGLRQEIYVAFVNQRSIIPDLEHCNIDRSLEPAPDNVWACRMVVICAEVLRYCYNGTGDPSAGYTALSESVSQWNDSKPASFEPVFYQPAKTAGNVFPELWFVGDDIVIGLQHYHLARILLAAHDPRIPRLGPGRAKALRTMDEEIRTHVRALCGMCLSNPSAPPNFTYASMGITMAGDKFSDRDEQEAMLRILETCDREHGYFTGAAKKDLELGWGWGTCRSNLFDA